MDQQASRHPPSTAPGGQYLINRGSPDPRVSQAGHVPCGYPRQAPHYAIPDPSYNHLMHGTRQFFAGLPTTTRYFESGLPPSPPPSSVSVATSSRPIATTVHSSVPYHQPRPGEKSYLQPVVPVGRSDVYAPYYQPTSQPSKVAGQPPPGQVSHAPGTSSAVQYKEPQQSYHYHELSQQRPGASYVVSDQGRSYPPASEGYVLERTPRNGSITSGKPGTGFQNGLQYSAPR